MFIDTHAHLDFPDYAADLPEVLDEANNAGIKKIINVGSSLKGSLESITLAEIYPFIYAAVGLHPHEANSADLNNQLEKIKKLAQKKKVAAIGECGLDYHSVSDNKEKQKNLFIAQLNLAGELNKPVILHVRDSHEDSLQIIKKFPNLKGAFHCFSGNETFLERVLGLGFYVGFDGNLTFKNAQDLQIIARIAPLDKILLETDSPYLSPVPYRGQRNSPSRIVDIARFLADLKGLPAETIAVQTTANAQKLFRFDTI